MCPTVLQSAASIQISNKGRSKWWSKCMTRQITTLARKLANVMGQTLGTFGYRNRQTPKRAELWSQRCTRIKFSTKINYSRLREHRWSIVVILVLKIQRRLLIFTNNQWKAPPPHLKRGITKWMKHKACSWVVLGTSTLNSPNILRTSAGPGIWLY